MTIPWLTLTIEQRRAVINNVRNQSGFPAKAIEKDWWVTIVLKALFNLISVKNQTTSIFMNRLT
jgi:hypothetical protein